MNTNENIISKLEYIGLNFNNIPEFLTEFEPLNYNPPRNYSEKNYKVYKYINVKDIEIFITPTDRLASISEKYTKAVPICAYLNPNSEENIEKHAHFLKMVKELEVSDIEYLEKQQETFNQMAPYKIKYHKDYLWQIYYSEETDKYFMLTTENDEEYSALFYLLKKQLENSNEMIYVPICYSAYSSKYLFQTEMIDIENELWYFTKNWPEFYETYDKMGNMSLNILGNICIYNAIMSYYKIVLNSKEEAINFYKLLKAIFILQTEVPKYYNFTLKLSHSGNIKIFDLNKEITYENLKEYVRDNYLKIQELSVKKTEEKMALDKKIQSLKELSKKLDIEYIEKEKHISTFLECKKTFFGKIKYFFKYKKKKSDLEKNDTVECINKQTIKYCQRPDSKEFYTVEELLDISKKLMHDENSIKSLELDLEALNKRIEMMNKKIENATLYIKEIDKHKKSIFDFWKFTNTEELAKLNGGTEEATPPKKLKKAFNIKTDYDDVSKQIDNIQRKIFSKEELESIFIATTPQLEDINLVNKNKQIPAEHLNNLKKELKEKNNVSSFDIFGSIIEANNQIRTLGNEKHREIERNKFSILKISENTTLEEYTNTVNDILNTIKSTINKMNFNLELPVYKIENKLENGFTDFHLNPENILNDIQSDEINLIKINLKESTKCLAFSNIIYYDNLNKTLPLGMNVTDKILLDIKNTNLRLTSENIDYLILDSKQEGRMRYIKITLNEYEA